MKHERVTLPRTVREYYAAIGSRGGSAGRRELTRKQAKAMVAIREANRVAKKRGKKGSAKVSKHQRAILRRP